jgi:hypothetical protein
MKGEIKYAEVRQESFCEQNLLTAAVIEFRGAAIGVASDALSSFEGAVVFQKIRDTGRPE